MKGGKGRREGGMREGRKEGREEGGGRKSRKKSTTTH